MVRTWLDHVQERLEARELEPFEPPKRAMRPVPVYRTLAECLHLSGTEAAWTDEAELPQPTGADIGALLDGLGGSSPVA